MHHFQDVGNTLLPSPPSTIIVGYHSFTVTLTFEMHNHNYTKYHKLSNIVLKYANFESNFADPKLHPYLAASNKQQGEECLIEVKVG